MPDAIHPNCVGCANACEGFGGADASLILLAMLLSGRHSLDELRRDLCFVHRRTVEGVSRAVRAL